MGRIYWPVGQYTWLTNTVLQSGSSSTVSEAVQWRLTTCSLFQDRLGKEGQISLTL